MVRRAIQHHGLGRRILPIPLKFGVALGRCFTECSWRGVASQAHQEMAPWSLLKRVVSSSLTVEAQSLFSGFGHAEWNATCVAEMTCPHFEFELQSKFYNTSSYNVLWSQNHSVIILYPCHHFQVWKIKRCGFRLVVARLRATIRWAPTDTLFDTVVSIRCPPNKRCSNVRQTEETDGNVTGVNRRPAT